MLVKVLIPALIVLVLLPPAFGELDFTTDKDLYHDGDMMTVSGSVGSDPAYPTVNIQIFSPHSILFEFGLAEINSDGSFSKEFLVSNKSWKTDGTYQIKAFYGDQKPSKTISYQELADEAPDPAPEPRPETPQQSETQQPAPPPVPEEPTFETLKLIIPDFPSYDKAPKYYIDRYDAEPAYKEWFDSQFPSHSIEDVVGYAPTHIEGFPSHDKSPQYFIDRYGEPAYKEWFDSQFPGESIHNILGYADPAPIPDWIKDAAAAWGNGETTVSEFEPAIAHLVDSGLITVSGAPDSTNEEIPGWVRSGALWWSKGLVSDATFLDSIKFLILEGLIPAN